MVEQVFASGLEVTTYLVIGRPPFDPGIVHHTSLTPVVFAAANTPVGASGTAAGTADADGSDRGPAPTTFSATTVKV